MRSEFLWLCARDRHGYRKRNSEPLSPFFSMKLFLRTAQLQRLCEYSGTISFTIRLCEEFFWGGFYLCSAGESIPAHPPTHQHKTTCHRVPLSSALKCSESKSPPGGEHHEEIRQRSTAQAAQWRSPLLRACVSCYRCLPIFFLFLGGSALDFLHVSEEECWVTFFWWMLLFFSKTFWSFSGTCVFCLDMHQQVHVIAPNK